MRTTPIRTEDQAAGNGRATALGKAGTGWMAALDSIVDEAITDCRIKAWPSAAAGHVELMERLFEYSHGWVETLQFGYEVDHLFRPKRDQSSEDTIWRLEELRDAWVNGYVEVLLGKVVKQLQEPRLPWTDGSGSSSRSKISN